MISPPRARLICASALLLLALPAFAQSKSPDLPASTSGTAQVQSTMPGSKGASSSSGSPAAGQTGDTKPAAGSKAGPDAAPNARDYASGKQVRLGPLDPAPPPVRAFANRPRIALALGGGGALALSEVGVLQWFEEHHIPVDEIAGTSMGCMVSALYSTGRSPEELKTVMNDRVFTSVFSFTQSFTSRSFRRREDSRELPNGITVGLRHGVSFRNAVLTDQGLNAFLDRNFFRYDDQTDFNTLPIPLRCVSTDLTTAEPVTFARGSIPDAIRASVSLPGVYQPFSMGGHEYVDGGVLENLPTPAVQLMQPDVILAVSLPLAPVQGSDLTSILAVLARSFSVAIEGAERNQRKLANVVMMPDITGFGAADYLKTPELAQRGYAAAEAHKTELLAYALSDDDWKAYLVHRTSLRHAPPAPVLRVRVLAPTDSATLAVQRLFAPLVNQPVNTKKIESLLDQVRSDGRYEADYTVGYESRADFQAQQQGKAKIKAGAVDVKVDTGSPASSASDASPGPGTPSGTGEASSEARPSSAGTPRDTSPSAAIANPNTPAQADPDHPVGTAATAQTLAAIDLRPILLVTVTDKKTGPPFLLLGANVQASVPAITRATIEGILTDQDLGGYGSELRTTVKLGYLTELGTEYFHPVFSTNAGSLFVAPRTSLLRQPFPIYTNQVRLAERQLQNFSVGGDIGLTNSRNSELRAGIDFSQIRWTRIIGQDPLPDVYGQSQLARLQYTRDTQDRALVPDFGYRVIATVGFLYDTVGSQNAPRFTWESAYAHRFRFLEPETLLDKETNQQVPNKGKTIFFLAADAGTLFNRSVAQPFRFTLGGPLRLSASAIDEYRGTDYFLVQPAIGRRLAQLPQPLGQSIYFGFGAEIGQVRAPDMRTITREDAFIGLFAETPIGVVTLAPAIGSNGERKFVFTLGKLF